MDQKWPDFRSHRLNCFALILMIMSFDDADEHSVRINFDLDLPVAEILVTTDGIISFWDDPIFFPEVAEYDLKITPTKLIFTPQARNFGPRRISVDRLNLLIEVSGKNPDGGMAAGSGTCKIQKGSRKI